MGMDHVIDVGHPHIALVCVCVPPDWDKTTLGRLAETPVRFWSIPDRSGSPAVGYGSPPDRLSDMECHCIFIDARYM